MKNKLQLNYINGASFNWNESYVWIHLLCQWYTLVVYLGKSLLDYTLLWQHILVMSYVLFWMNLWQFILNYAKTRGTKNNFKCSQYTDGTMYTPGFYFIFAVLCQGQDTHKQEKRGNFNLWKDTFTSVLWVDRHTVVPIMM